MGDFLSTPDVLLAIIQVLWPCVISELKMAIFSYFSALLFTSINENKYLNAFQYSTLLRILFVPSLCYSPFFIKTLPETNILNLFFLIIMNSELGISCTYSLMGILYILNNLLCLLLLYVSPNIKNNNWCFLR